MPTSTAKWALPYPVAADPADVPTDMGALAARIEAVGPYAWAQTNGTFVAPGPIYSQQTGTGTGFIYNPSAAGGAAFYSAVQGEANSRFYFDSNGKQWWGPGGSTAVDTNLYRNGAALLQTDSTFKAVGYIAAGVTAGREVGLGWSGIPGGNPGIYFGAATDTNLYRTSAANLRTDGAFYATAQVYVGDRLYLGYATGADTSLYRGAANQVKTDGALVSGSIVLSGAGITIAGDTNMYRVGAGFIGTDQKLFCGSSFIYVGTVVADTAMLEKATSNTLGVVYNNGSAWAPVWALSFNVQSDRKAKRNIRKAKIAPEKLLSAGIYKYKHEEGDGEEYIGLMADELPEEVLLAGKHPLRADGTRKSEETLGFVDLYKLSTALVATVQHLNERITALEGA